MIAPVDSGGGGIVDVDPSVLTRIAGLLDSTGTALFPHASTLQTTPDAGVSTEMVATAMGALAAAVAGLSGHIGDLASSTGVASSGYSTTDQGIAGNWQAMPR